MSKAEDLIEVILSGRYRFKVAAGNLERKNEDPVRAREGGKKEAKDKKEQPRLLLPPLSNYQYLKMRKEKRAKEIEGRQTGNNFMKKADVLIEREELDDNDLEIIVAEINKQEGDFKDKNVSKQ